MGFRYDGRKKSTQLYERLMGPLVLFAVVVLLLQWIADKVK